MSSFITSICTKKLPVCCNYAGKSLNPSTEEKNVKICKRTKSFDSPVSLEKLQVTEMTIARRLKLLLSEQDYSFFNYAIPINDFLTSCSHGLQRRQGNTFSLATAILCPYIMPCIKVSHRSIWDSHTQD